jgi:hypothetical protein
MDIFDGAANGNEVSWKVSITDPMDMTLEFAGAIEGDRISGSVKLGPFGDARSPAPAPSAAPARSGQTGSGPRSSCSGLRLVHRRLRHARPQSGRGAARRVGVTNRLVGATLAKSCAPACKVSGAMAPKPRSQALDKPSCNLALSRVRQQCPKSLEMQPNVR